MILEVNLYNFIGESKHDCMPGTHPFFNINYIFNFPNFRCFRVIFLKHCFRFVMTFKITPEMLKKSDFLLEFFWVFS